MSLALVAALPKTYDVTTTIQVSPTQVISGLSGAGQPAQGTRSTTLGTYAAETVLSRQNLVALVRQTDLIEKWPKTRAPLPRLKDAIWSRLFPPPTPEVQLDIFVGILASRFWVTSDQTTVTIGIHFPDPQVAVRLVEAAQENFLAARQVQEISTVTEGIAILEDWASQAREALDQSLKKLEEVRRARAAKLGRQASLPPASIPTLDSPGRRGSQLQLQVDAKQRELAALIEARKQRIAELESRLQQERAVYSEIHPAVVETRESLEALQRQPPPEIAGLQQELAPLEAEMRQRGLLSDVPLKAQRGRHSAIDATALEPFDPLEEQDPEINQAKTELHHAYARYNGLQDRIQAGRLELDSARAAFKYRYVVIRPAQYPRGPVAPKTPLVVIASVVAGLVLAAFGSAFVELASRTFVEDWQVEQALGVPLLGTLPDL
jgi:capsular polysaccharide biosynthesis protein